MFQVLDLADELLVVRKEWRAGIELPAYQRIANEYLARFLRIDQAEIDAALAIHHQPVQGGALRCGYLRRTFFPARLAIRSFQQMGANPLQPFRLDLRDATRIQAAGIDQLGRHHPLAGLLRQMRTRPQMEFDGARAKVM